MRKIKYLVLLLILVSSCQISVKDTREYRIIEVTDTVPITEYKWKSGKRILREQSGKDTIGWREVKRYYRVYD